MRRELKLTCAALLGAAFLGVTGVAEATVVEPSPIDMLPMTLPGISLGVGGVITTIGAGLTMHEPANGWATSSIVLGALNLASGSIYAGITLAAQDEIASKNFLPVAIANYAVGAFALSYGLVGAATGGDQVEVAELPVLPVVSLDADGRPYAALVGRF
jgi:hypothetical protein